MGEGFSIGLTSSYLALFFGCFYLIYATKYYISSIIALKILQNSKTNNDLKNLLFYSNIPLTKKTTVDDPWVSIHLPFFNELNVARRIIKACINLDYSNYEILVADDSKDETIKILKEIKWRLETPIIKFIHRKNRIGFKGGALQKALQFIHPKTKYVVVLDADFVPPKTLLRQFINMMKELQKKSKENNEKEIAALQGYQLHYLNKNENWITKGVRAEFSGSYMVERVAEEFFDTMKMISGSVFMFRADVLEKLGWSTSITEDWELTIRLYLEGYRVAYTPLIQSSAEIPNTIKRLVRQRMRWAEGHTFAVKKYFIQTLLSKKLTIMEKLEFLYFAPYYLQSFFFIISSICWVIAEISRKHPSFWNSSLGATLLISNFFSIPLMELTGLYLEGELLEDYKGVFSFIALSLIITPFQAYAALNGLLEPTEGTWIRTLKTGNITDKVLGIKFRIFHKWFQYLKKIGKSLTKYNPKRSFIKVPTRSILIIISLTFLILPYLKLIEFALMNNTSSIFSKFTFLKIIKVIIFG